MVYHCVYCRGKYPEHLCSQGKCPMLTKYLAVFKAKDAIASLGKEGNAQAPAVFVGRFDYPHVNVGIMTPPSTVENAQEYDAPRQWALQGYSLPQVVDMRATLLNSRWKSHVSLPSSSLLSAAQDISMAEKPVDVEFQLKDKPMFRMNFDDHAAPHGPNAMLEKVDITSNPSISHKVDKVVHDTDLLAQEGLQYLFQHGYDENFLTKLLSVGNLGKEENRKLVPTRWSITAVDDTLGKKAISEIKNYETGGCEMMFGGFMGNYYLILFFPHVWSYELFEMYMPQITFDESHTIKVSTDYEGFPGRKEYAEETVGGYYASRLPILEWLKGMKKQATVLVFRFVTDEYSIPLGVWVVREATRKSVNSRVMGFESKEDMLSFARKFVKLRFHFNLDVLLAKSKVMKESLAQRSLKGFL